MTFHMDSAMKHSYSNDDTCFSIDVINEILEEDFDALLYEGSKILHSIKGTILEEKLFVEFDEFIAMTTEENSESESDTEEPPFEKITFNTDYKIKTSLEEPPLALIILSQTRMLSTEKTVPIVEGSSETTTEGYMKNYNNVSQDIQDQLNAKAKAVQIILTWIDNDIYSTVNAYPNACEMWKAVERTLSNTSRANQDNTPRINKGTGYDNQRVVNVAGARENVGTQVVQQSGIQYYNCKEYGHVARKCQKLKRTKDAAYHKEKMLLSHYLYMAQIQEVTPDDANNSRPIFDTEPLQKVQNDDDDYNVFANDREHPKQPDLLMTHI
nr:reverse transcriptase domain-containing protein [Tanacetum cinerariifolium]